MSDSENFRQVNRAHNKKKKEKFRKKHAKPTENEEGHKSPDEADLNEKEKFERAKKKNPKAFALNSFVAAERQFRRLHIKLNYKKFFSTINFVRIM